LTPWEKTDYINAVKCLAKKPAKTPAGLAAGAKNRYDDFVATHINQTLAIHGTVRYYTLRVHVHRSLICPGKLSHVASLLHLGI
jgi:hypothetical protein